MNNIELNLPLVTCIMPTYNRRAFVPHAICYFLRENYPNKELIIVDDGTDSIKDLIPDDKQIKYIRLQKKITVGEKRNICVLEGKGDLITHWDDDDWYSATRLKYQVERLLEAKTAVCGINNLLYFNLLTKKAHQYIYPHNQRVWLAGSSICYTRELWNHHKFVATNIGEDGLFIWSIPFLDKITVLSDTTFAVHTIHNSNVSPKKTCGRWWHDYSIEEIQKILDTDWIFYNNGCFNQRYNQ